MTIKSRNLTFSKSKWNNKDRNRLPVWDKDKAGGGMYLSCDTYRDAEGEGYFFICLPWGSFRMNAFPLALWGVPAH